LGTVGGAVVELVRKNSSKIEERTGLRLRVKSGCDIRKVRVPCAVTRNPNQIINDPDIAIVVEAMGGVNPAKKLILQAIAKGKSVVTSNKELIAVHMEEILKAAARKGVSVLFEGAVGGGIPILGVLRNNLAANRVSEVFGIVNGTTNYILSKMSREGWEFSRALNEARRQGYAEADPRMDIEGLDAVYKAVILASVAFGARIYWREVHCEGISRITQEDIRYAEEIGYVIKLLAVAKKVDGQVEVRVHPTLVPKDHPLSFIPGPMNAIYVKGDAIGEMMFYGQGAGGLPTASAVVSDIIEAVNPKSQIQNPKFRKVKVRPIEEIFSRYYIRLTAPDKHGVLAGISRAFADAKVSIAAVMQKETVGKTATIVIIIHEAKEANLMRAVAKLKKLSVVSKICNIIRVGL